MIKDSKRYSSPFKVTYQSDKVSEKVLRQKAKKALRKGEEPQPQYRTGKFWVD